jgi:hypothetical protein
VEHKYASQILRKYHSSLKASGDRLSIGIAKEIAVLGGHISVCVAHVLKVASPILIIGIGSGPCRDGYVFDGTQGI